MATIINDNLALFAPKALDARTMKFSGGTAVPFADVADANARIDPAERYVYLSVLIGSPVKEYWYFGGIADGDLVLKQLGGQNMANADLVADTSHTTDYATFNYTLTNAQEIKLISSSGTVQTQLYLEADDPSSSWVYSNGTSGANANINLNDNGIGIAASNTNSAQINVNVDGTIRINPQGTTGHSNNEVLTLIDNSTGEIGYAPPIVLTTLGTFGLSTYTLSTNTLNIPQYAPLTTFDGVISGGTVTWITGYTYNVSASVYAINGVIYSSPSTDVTLDPADPTDDRIDLFVLTTLGTADKVTGTPSTPPATPDYNSNDEIQIGFATVAAASTQPTIPTESIYLENTEWVTAVNTGNINPSSTNNPYAGSKDIEGTTVVNNNRITFTPASFPDINQYDSLIFKIRSKANWGPNRRFIIQFYNGTIAIGNAVQFGNGSFGFVSATTGVYQNILIPLYLFGNINAATNLRWTMATSGGSVGFYIDNIQLTFEGVVPPPAVGTVTTFSSGNLSPLFNTTVTNNSSTPALTFAQISQAANTVFSGPTSGGSANPTFRALVAADIPSLSSVYVPVGRTLTINGSAQDLSANRTWSVGTVTSISTTSPILGGTITSTGTISIQQSTTSQDGYLSSTDWNTFNGKQAALSGTGLVKSTAGVITYVNGTSGQFVKGNATLASLSSGDVTTALGFTPVTNARTLTINGTTFDLSANRTWSLANGTGTTASTNKINLGGSLGGNTVTLTATSSESFNFTDLGAININNAWATNAPNFSLIDTGGSNDTFTIGPGVSGGNNLVEMSFSHSPNQAIITWLNTGKLMFTNQTNPIPTSSGDFFQIWGGEVYLDTLNSTANAIDVLARDQVTKRIVKTSVVSGVSSVNGGTGAVTITVTGTTNRISVSGATGLTPTIDIDAAYVGQTSITTLGTIATGVWSGTAIVDGKLASSYILADGTRALTGNWGMGAFKATSLQTATAANTVVSAFEGMNTTTSSAANQMYGGFFVSEGQGWKTNATAASQEVGFRWGTIPIQGAAAPVGQWTLQQNIAGGSYATVLTVTSNALVSNFDVSGINWSSGSPYSIRNNTPSNTTAAWYNFVPSTINNMTWQSGTGGIMQIASNFSPVSGTAVYNNISIEPTINQTGGSNGITRGLYVAGTLTAVSDFRPIEINRNGLATTATAGIYLSNTTAAAAGAQQESPSLVLEGQGWKTTATAASQQARLYLYSLPVQGTANPTSRMVCDYQVNAGTVTNLFFFDSASGLSIKGSSGGTNGINLIGGAASLNTITANGLTFSYSSGQAGAGGNNWIVGGGTAPTWTSGTGSILAVTTGFAPTSGTAVFSALLLQNTINQTGGANGITRGLWINPTVTASADTRYLEIGAGTATAVPILLTSGTNSTAVKAGAIEFNGTNLFFSPSSTRLAVAMNASAAAPATTGTMTTTLTNLSVMTITPSNACTFNASGGIAGQECTFVITTSGTSSFTLTWGTNYKTQGTLATGTVSGKVFTVTFIYDGTNWNEQCRSTAM